ncbi:putative F-actin-capping protein subunit beta [Vitis vinifera]|uniref:F-actin-capping protein subunit beta n=1 Tax=Vitis vinifera TaxID=29760 RepID=A0A438IDT8_VITVI|nr:putative F-actin-capping protein subunit beta [Vitis vinifera]
MRRRGADATDSSQALGDGSLRAARLLPHLSSDLLSQVDQPLQILDIWRVLGCGVKVFSPSSWTKVFSLRKQVLCDVDSGKEFILCEYNRDADSYRSPWSNKYHPPLEDGPYPSSELRKLEIEANEVFSIYRDQYYEGGISSVYMWEDENEGFVACFLIKKDGSKTGHGRRGYLQEGSWDAYTCYRGRIYLPVTQLVESKNDGGSVGPDEEGITHYCLTSTVMLSLTTNDQSSGTFSLSGSIRRQMNMDLSIADGHLCNMGKMIEEMESKLRNSLDQVYFGKTKEMVCTLRPPAEVLPMRLPDS